MLHHEELVMTRPVLFLGRVNSGKTTAINVLRNSTYQNTPYSTTITPMSYEYKYKSWNFRFLDTPGFISGLSGEIKDKIFSFIIKKFDSIDFIFFVVSLKDGLIDDDLAFLELTLSLFRGHDKNINLLLMHSENLTEKDLNMHRDQIIHHPKLKHINFSHHLNTFFLGSSQSEDHRENISKMRSNIMEHISGTVEKIKIVDTYFFKSYINDFQEKYFDMISSYVDSSVKAKNLETTIDYFKEKDVNYLKQELKNSRALSVIKKKKFSSNLFFKEPVHPDILSFLFHKTLLEEPRIKVLESKQFVWLKKTIEQRDKQIEALRDDLEKEEDAKISDRIVPRLAPVEVYNFEMPKKSLRKSRPVVKEVKKSDSIFFKLLVVVAFFYIILRDFCINLLDKFGGIILY